MTELKLDNKLLDQVNTKYDFFRLFFNWTPHEKQKEVLDALDEYANVIISAGRRFRKIREYGF